MEILGNFKLMTLNFLGNDKKDTKETEYESPTEGKTINKFKSIKSRESLEYNKIKGFLKTTSGDLFHENVLHLVRNPMGIVSYWFLRIH